MQLSIRSLLILTLILALGQWCLLTLVKSSGRSWARGITRGSAVDNPGFAIWAAEIEQLLGSQLFVPCERPKTIDDYSSMRGHWFRSTKHARMYAFVYADNHSLIASVYVSTRGSTSKPDPLKRYIEELVDDFSDLWNEQTHQLQDWTEVAVD